MNLSIVRYVVARLLQIEAHWWFSLWLWNLLYRESGTISSEFLSRVVFWRFLGAIKLEKAGKQADDCPGKASSSLRFPGFCSRFSAVCLLSSIRIFPHSWMPFLRRAADSRQPVRAYWMMWNLYPIQFILEKFTTWLEVWGFWCLHWLSCRKSIPNQLISWSWNARPYFR